MDRLVGSLIELAPRLTPAGGWIATVRSALGMTQAQLGRRLGIDEAGLSRYQRGERRGSVTLDTLRKTADAMECDLVYAFVPRAGSFEAMVRQRAQAVAQREVASVGHSMALEDQAVDEERTSWQVDLLASRIAEEVPSKLWDDVT